MFAFILELPVWALIVLVVVAIGFLNGVVKLFQEWGKAIGAPAKPLSITLKTAQTPQEVMDAARAARFKRRLTVVLVLAAVWLVGLYYRPEVVAPITNRFIVFIIDLVALVGEVLSNISIELYELLREREQL